MANLTDIRSSWSTGASEGGVTVYATKEDLPTSGLTSGDQAYVTGNSRFYISNGSGWYNVALVNATPALTISPAGIIELSTAGTATTITLTGTDSDNAVDGLTFSVESDGSFAGLASLSQDSSVFTITPLSEDSATTTSSTLTFKASDGISFGSGDRTLTLEFKVQNSNYTTLMLKADTAGTNNQVDASSTGTTVTKVGSLTSTALSPYHPGGYSTYFDGSGGDWIKTDTHADFAFQAGDFTIECWYYPVSKAQNYPRILHFGTYWSNNQSWALLDRHNSNNTKFWVTSFSGISIVSTTTVENNNWYHLAVERSGTTLTLYVNGIAEGTANVSTNNYPDASATSYLNIGNVSNGSNLNEAAANGYVRDVRVVKGSAVYTSNFTPSTSPLTAVTNTKFLLDTKIIKDISGEEHTATANGSVTSQRFGPYDYNKYTKAGYGGSVYFPNNVANSYRVDGTTAYGTGDFTLEFWVWLESAAANCTLFDGRPTGGNGSYVTIAHSTIDGVGLYVNAAYRIQSGSPLPTNQWYHIAVSRVSGTTTMYVNGKSIGNFSDSFNYIAGASRPLVGRNGYASSSPVDGYISDLRSVKGTGVYTTNFTPPAAPLTDVTNTELLTFTNQNDIWDAGSGNLLTKAGNVTSSNTQRKFTTSSAVYFDGTSDYLSMPNDDNKFTIGDQDFTIELWHYPTALGATRNIYEARSAGTQVTPSLWLRDTGFYYYYVNGANRIEQPAGEITANNWYHVAVTRSGSSTKLFVNGVQKGNTYTDTNTYLAGGTNHYLGRHYSSLGSNEIIGYVQDFRFTKGLARYTANFTPPTSEFSG